MRTAKLPKVKKLTDMQKYVKIMVEKLKKHDIISVYNYYIIK